MRGLLLLSIPTALVALSACDVQPDNIGTAASDVAADAIYFGGDILTMEGESPRYVEAVTVRDGKIVLVGSKSAALRQAGEATQLIDLAGRTLMPGLIDPHLHPMLATILIQTEIIAYNDWDLPTGFFPSVQDQASYLERLDAAVAGHTSTTMPLISWGYHQLYHGDIHRALLDERYPDTPVVIWQYSFHELRLNSKAIELFGIDEDAARQHAQVEIDRGRFFERGAQTFVAPQLIPHVANPTNAAPAMRQVAEAIHQGGITLVADMTMPTLDFATELLLAREVLDSPETKFRTLLVPISTYYAPHPDQLEEAFETIERLTEHNTDKVAFVKQVKILADGAFFSQLMQLQDGYTDGHHGEWLTEPDELKQYVDFFWRKGYQIHIHTNGDAAVEVVLDLLADLQVREPNDDHRLTLHHLAYFTEAQAHRMAELGAMASVNTYFTYAMADKFAQHGLGEQRAARISAIGDLEKHNVSTSFHSDFFMAPAKPLTLVWAAVNRSTISGQVVGAELAADPYKALQAVTINAAFHIRQESEVGSLREGKRADFVVLGSNPLKRPVNEIKDIEILATVLGGEWHAL